MTRATFVNGRRKKFCSCCGAATVNGKWCCPACLEIRRRSTELLGHEVGNQPPHAELQFRLACYTAFAALKIPLFPARRRARPRERRS